MIDVAFDKVSKRYRIRQSQDAGLKDFWAVRDVSFQVGRGETLGIIGHNGAGKSTLLKLLSRITAPTAGTITLDGRLAALIEVGSGFAPFIDMPVKWYSSGMYVRLGFSVAAHVAADILLVDEVLGVGDAAFQL